MSIFPNFQGKGGMLAYIVSFLDNITSGLVAKITEGNTIAYYSHIQELKCICRTS